MHLHILCVCVMSSLNTTLSLQQKHRNGKSNIRAAGDSSRENWKSSFLPYGVENPPDREVKDCTQYDGI